jgi:hypothetical protein
MTEPVLLLLPCPFCGGEPQIDHNEDWDMDFIPCDCGACHWGEPEDWNKRVNVGGIQCNH